jgi:hypothetical protein
MKSLILYWSAGGNTEKIAKTIRIHCQNMFQGFCIGRCELSCMFLIISSGGV